MPPFDRHLWCAAGHLEPFLKCRAGNPLPEPPNSGVFKRLRALTDRLRKVEERGWHTAAKSVAHQIHGELSRCQAQINTALELVSTRFATSDNLTQPELYVELVALADEFEDFDFDLTEGTLSVATDSIELEGQSLGSFCITLNFKQELTSTSRASYVVQAAEPCCPAGRSHITHPHVMNDHLCEGEATPALRAALRTGRLTDFFQIVNQVLHTYNSGSPYASLDEWNGTECESCGRHVDSDDSSSCCICGTHMCDGCSTCCEVCDTTTCDGCLETCLRCETKVCPDCLKSCPGCGSRVCPNCLNTTTKRCQECEHVPATEECETPSVPTAGDPPTHPAVQSASLVQAAVPARCRPHRSRRFRRHQRRRSALRA